MERTVKLEKARLFESVGDTTFGEIVGSHLDQDLVSGKDADAVLAHASGGMGDDLMFVFELDPERGVRKQLRHDPGKFQKFFLCHPLPSVSQSRQAKRPTRKARKLAESGQPDNW
jgi:hypothetical protein